jgi:hypothetical protein
MIKLALVVGTSLMFATSIHAADAVPPTAPATYTLRETFVGSRIPQDVVRSAIPFDKRYEELTADEKAVLWKDYESPKAGDETPFPVAGLHHLALPLMKLAARQNYAGKLIASVDIDSRGRPREVTIYKSPDSEMSEMARSLLSTESYRAAHCDGQPCAMAFVLRLEFLRTR